MNLTIYNTNNCLFSYMLKQKLQNTDIQVKEVNIINQPNKLQELRNRGVYGIPILELDGQIIRCHKERELKKVLGY